MLDFLDLAVSGLVRMQSIASFAFFAVYLRKDLGHVVIQNNTV